jgi:hypothetical protein
LYPDDVYTFFIWLPTTNWFGDIVHYQESSLFHRNLFFMPWKSGTFIFSP